MNSFRKSCSFSAQEHRTYIDKDGSSGGTLRTCFGASIQTYIPLIQAFCLSGVLDRTIIPVKSRLDPKNLYNVCKNVCILEQYKLLDKL